MNHTRNDCLICGQMDQKTREAMRKYKRTNSEKDFQIVRTVAAERRRTQDRHRREMQPKSKAVPPEGYSYDFGVYQGGLPELGKNR